jgi:hypothetical protein
MSSNSSLSSAKRRRVGLPQPVGNTPSQSKSQYQTQSQVGKNVTQNKTPNSQQKQDKDMFESEYTSTSSNTGFPLLPPPPPGLSLNQILSTHHLYVNKMANDFSVAIDELGNTFNMLSSNCDNLNERLSSLEEGGTSSPKSDVSSNISLNVLDDNNFVSLSNDVNTLKERLNVFDTEFKELKELKVLLLKNQGLILDNTLNITNIKNDYSKKFDDLSLVVNNLTEELNKLKEVNNSRVNVSVDEYISNSLSESLNKSILSDNDGTDINDDNSAENISLSVYDN